MLPHQASPEFSGIEKSVSVGESSRFLEAVINHDTSMFDLPDKKVVMSLSSLSVFGSGNFYLEGVISRLIVEGDRYRLAIKADSKEYAKIISEFGPISKNELSDGSAYLLIELTKNIATGLLTDGTSGLEIQVLLKQI